MEKLSLFAKIQKARVMLQGRDLKKSGENKFAGFKYFELQDILPHINSIFDELGLFSYVDINDEVGILMIMDSETYDPSNKSTFIAFTMPSAKMELKGGNPIQNIGATQTYVRRYLYMLALDIAESDTLDSTIGKDNKATKGGKPKANNNLSALLNEATELKEKLKADKKIGVANKVIMGLCGKPTFNDVTDEELLKKLIEELKKL